MPNRKQGKEYLKFAEKLKEYCFCKNLIRKFENPYFHPENWKIKLCLASDANDVNLYRY